MMTTSKGNFQFLGDEFTNVAGETQRNIARFDIQGLRPTEVPHLNLEIQINGVPQPWRDPHTPIDPRSIRVGDIF